MAYLKKNLKKEIHYYKIEKLLKEYPFLFFYHFNKLTNQEKIDLKKKLSKIEKTDFLVVKNKVAHRMIKTEQITTCRDDFCLGKENLKEKEKSKKLEIKKISSLPEKGKGIILSFFPLPTATQSRVAEGKAEANPLRGVEEDPVKKRIRNDILDKLSPFLHGPTLLIGFSSLNHFKESAQILNQYQNLIFIVGFYENQIINHLDYTFLLDLDKSVQLKLIHLLHSKLVFYPLFSNLSKLLLLLTRYYKSKRKKS